MGNEGVARTAAIDDRITFTPPDSMISHAYECGGLMVESIVSRSIAPFSYHANPSRPLFVFIERSARTDGETHLEGLPSSARRNLSRTVSVVPPGHRLEGWSIPRIRTEATLFLLDEEIVRSFAERRIGSFARMAPQLFVESSSIEGTAHKLRGLYESGDAADTMYATALSVVLQHELLRLGTHNQSIRAIKGGLARWQEDRIREYIEEHLREGISIAALALIAGLSQSHFAHAFRVSFGQAPHQYFHARRIEAAKALLLSDTLSVTEIAQALGFSDTSAFAASFRMSTGLTPSRFRRG